MLTNDELSIHPHPLQRAYHLQKHIAELQMAIEGARTELNQILLYCNEKEQFDDDKFHLSVSRKIRHKVNPEKFAREFREANDELVQNYIVCISEGLKAVEQTRILPEINVAAAAPLVGKIPLYEKACDKSVTETYAVVVAPDK